MSHKNKHIVTGIICATVGFGIAYVLRRYRSNVLQKLRKFQVKNPQIVVVSTVEDCQLIVKNIESRCSHYRVLGFDCEWVTRNGRRCPIALMQIASSDGFCALIRLSTLTEFPQNLKKLLSDNTIIKVGVAPVDDAKYLFQDYGVVVQGCVDLRHLAEKLPRGGLSGMAKRYLGVDMDKCWKIRCSDWETDKLSERQVQYASQDALVAVWIFNQLMRPWWQLWGLPKWDKILQKCQRYVDVRYKTKPGRGSVSSCTRMPIKKSATRSYSTRQRPLYDNCILQAPDGEILSTCDHRKAEWYVFKGLGEIVTTDPLTVRLTFEPSGRAVGEVGKYYTTQKENQCVVCGKTESFIRKNIIPHEYRKFFPPVMKDHMSHDILLLCLECHLRSNILDVMMRNQLAEKCNAPIGIREDVKVFDIPDLKKVRSAARALLSKDVNKIPPARRKQLENTLRIHFEITEDQELTQSMLMAATNTTVR
ncbi:Exonuclease 3'-5' domain-containing protein 2 [Blattella germanica]|nr:Exonuclease 3'-5' domain-containing protein 2 [Blattella germanica]